MDIASPWDHRVYENEGERIEKYQDLKKEMGRLSWMRHLEVAPVVVGALGLVSNRLDAWLEKLGVTITTGRLQKRALLGTARILRKLLESLRIRNDTKDLWPLAVARSFGVTSAGAKALHLHLHNNNNNNDNNNDHNHNHNHNMNNDIVLVIVKVIMMTI